MRKNKRILSWICALLCVVLLAGCAGTSAPTDESGLSDTPVTEDGRGLLGASQQSNGDIASILAAADVKLHFLCLSEDDDGQDAILIESHGKFGFVDCGTYAKREQTMSIMEELGVTKDNLVFVIGTHAHGDHIGFLDSLIYQYHPERIYLLPFEADDLVDPKTWTDKAWENAMNQADACGVPVINAFKEGASEEPWTTKNKKNRYTASPHFTFGDAEIDIYNFYQTYHKTKVVDANDTSLVVKVTAGGHTALLTGDVSNAPKRGTDRGWDEKAVADEIGHVDILKISHHGWGFYNTNLPEDLAKFSASYIIQTGALHFLPMGDTKDEPNDSFGEVLREIKMGAVYASTFWYDRRIIGEAGLGAITFDMATLENNIPDSYSIMAFDREGTSYMFRGGRLAEFTLDAGDVYISNGQKNESGTIKVDGIDYTVNGDSKIVGASGQKWERFR